MSNTPRLAIAIPLLLSVACSSGTAPGTDPPSRSTEGLPTQVAAPATPTDTSTATAETPTEGKGVTPLSGATAARGTQAPFWPRFHGPKGDNLSTDTGLLKAWPEGGPELAWSTKGLGQGFASVTMADGLIYTAGNVDEKTVITALDMDGNIQWQVDNGKAWTGSSPGTRGTPTIDGDRLYHESPLGDVVCLNAKRGERIWGLNILDAFGAENIEWALAESLLIDGDHVICCPGGAKASVVALDKQSGKTVWAAQGTGEQTSYASPTLAQHGGLRMFLTMNAKALIGVNADTGDFLFRHEHLTSYDVNALKPIYHEGHVFISSGYGSGSELLKINVDGNRATVVPVWQSKELDNHHGGVLLLDGYLYGSSYQGKWVCLKWETGERMYADRGVGKGSLTYADGMLYTYSEKRKVGLVEATPTAHTVISQFEIPRGGEGPSWPHPVVCGGRLYLRHGDVLFAYNVRTER